MKYANTHTHTLCVCVRACMHMHAHACILRTGISIWNWLPWWEDGFSIRKLADRFGQSKEYPFPDTPNASSCLLSFFGLFSNNALQLSTSFFMNTFTVHVKVQTYFYKYRKCQRVINSNLRVTNRSALDTLCQRPYFSICFCDF